MSVSAIHNSRGPASRRRDESSARKPAGFFLSSVQEGDVAGGDVHHVDVHRVQRAQHGLHDGPAVAELVESFALPSCPINPNGIEINQPRVARNELPWVTGSSPDLP